MASGGVRIDALLAQQGLRSKASGHQVTTEEVVRAQCGGLFESFGKLRRRRSGSEYPRQLMRRIVRMVAPLLLRNGMRCHRGVSSLPAVNCQTLRLAGRRAPRHRCHPPGCCGRARRRDPQALVHSVTTDTVEVVDGLATMLLKDALLACHASA